MLQVNLRKFASDLPPQYLEAVINSPAAVWDIVPEVSFIHHLREDPADIGDVSRKLSSSLY